MFLYGRIVNNISSKYGIELYGKYGNQLRIWHGPIVINSLVQIGDNCQLHGNNCIGTNGTSEECAKIGNNVEVGFGTTIIGNISICDNVIIGANSLVNKSIEEPGIYAGIPAKKIKGIDYDE